MLLQVGKKYVLRNGTETDELDYMYGRFHSKSLMLHWDIEGNHDRWRTLDALDIVREL